MTSFPLSQATVSILIKNALFGLVIDKNSLFAALFKQSDT